MIGAQSNRRVNRYFGLDKVMDDVEHKLTFFCSCHGMQYCEITDEHIDKDYAQPLYRVVIEVTPEVKDGGDLHG